MINNLRTSILEVLRSLNNLAEVNDGIPSRFAGYPSAFFTFDRVESSVMDSNHNERVYYFTINLFQETTTLSVVLSEKILCDLIDDIITTFDRTDFDGLALNIDAVGGNISAVETESGPALHGTIVLGIHTSFLLK